jgi:hypothetical protein
MTVSKSKLPKIKDRIRAALAVSQKTFLDVAIEGFPEQHYPRAFEYQANGGPPGCYMALGRAVREMVNDGPIAQWHTGIGPGHRHLKLIAA